MKWRKGPDVVTVVSGEGQGEPVKGIYLTITTEDSAIELDKIAEIEFVPGSQLLDGEIQGEVLLNRPIGLFRVDKLKGKYDPGNPDASEFVPDRLFYSGEELFSTGTGDVLSSWVRYSGLAHFDHQKWPTCMLIVYLERP